MADTRVIEVHPLDEHLGAIHEIALSLAMQGLHNTGSRLANAHEVIQTFVIELEAERDTLQADKERLESALGCGARKMSKLSTRAAKKIILALVDAATDGMLVQHQDGGKTVDIIHSQIKGQEDAVMTLEESERRLDRAIRGGYAALTGRKVVGDPVEFINS